MRNGFLDILLFLSKSTNCEKTIKIKSLFFFINSVMFIASYFHTPLVKNTLTRNIFANFWSVIRILLKSIHTVVAI